MYHTKYVNELCTTPSLLILNAVVHNVTAMI